MTFKILSDENTANLLMNGEDLKLILPKSIQNQIEKSSKSEIMYYFSRKNIISFSFKNNDDSTVKCTSLDTKTIIDEVLDVKVSVFSDTLSYLNNQQDNERKEKIVFQIISRLEDIQADKGLKKDVHLLDIYVEAQKAKIPSDQVGDIIKKLRYKADLMEVTKDSYIVC